MDTIRVGQVEIENFFSVNSLVVDYANQGLVGVYGKNGSGKSSAFVEALCYGLFGVSIRGITKDDVINRFVGSNCHIGIPLMIGDDVARIDTYRKHKKFKDSVIFSVNGQTKGFTGNTSDQTRDNIARYLDMDYTSFTNAVVFGQAMAEYFSGLTDSKQKEIVERILGITWIPRAYTIATGEANDIRKEINSMQTELAVSETQLDKLINQLNSAVSEFNSFEVERAKRIVKIQEATEALKPKPTSKQEQKIKDIEELINDVDDHLVGREKVEAGLNQVMKELGGLSATQEMKADRVSKIKSKLANVSKLKVGTTCETCGQEIVDVESYVIHLKEEKKGLLEDIDKLDAQIVDIDQNKKLGLTKQKLDYNQLDSEKKNLQEELDQEREVLNQINLDNTKILGQIESLIKEAENIGKEVNTFQPLMDSLSKDIDSTGAKQTELNSSLHFKNSELSYHAFWEEGFSNKGMKSLIIDSMIPQMNKWALTYARALGGKFDVSFSTQKAIKSGELREKFYVKSENNLGAVVYDGNSGGEKRVIDTIVMFVLGDLAASRSSKRFSLLILDEVFERLDESICDSIMRVLKAMVMDKDSRDEEFKDLPYRESIFVLTHLDYLKSKFSKKAKVSRESTYTTFEIQ